MIKCVIKNILKIFKNPRIRYHSSLFRDSTNTFQYNFIEKFFDTSMDYLKANQIEGDYLEFGIHKGRSFIPAYHLSKTFNLKMKCYGFDSFEGLPASSEKKYPNFNRFDKGKFCCSLEQLQINLSKAKVNLDDIELIKGFFKDTLNKNTKNKLNIEKASIINVDCDLYESTKYVLDFVTEYIQDGTIILFDDWFTYRGNSKMGEQRAFRKWLKKNKNVKSQPFYQHDQLGKSFLLFKNI